TFAREGDHWRLAKRPAAIEPADRRLSPEPPDRLSGGAHRGTMMPTAKPSDKRLELPHFDLSEFVRRVLAEDLGSGGDVTTDATIAADARFTAEMNCREPITLAGLDIAIAFFRPLARDVPIKKE